MISTFNLLRRQALVLAFVAGLMLAPPGVANAQFINIDWDIHTGGQVDQVVTNMGILHAPSPYPYFPEANIINTCLP